MVGVVQGGGGECVFVLFDTCPPQSLSLYNRTTPEVQIVQVLRSARIVGVGGVCGRLCVVGDAWVEDAAAAANTAVVVVAAAGWRTGVFWDSCARARHVFISLLTLSCMSHCDGPAMPRQIVALRQGKG